MDKVVLHGVNRILTIRTGVRGYIQKERDYLVRVLCSNTQCELMTGNALERVQRVQAPADLWDITFCTR